MVICARFFFVFPSAEHTYWKEKRVPTDKNEEHEDRMVLDSSIKWRIVRCVQTKVSDNSTWSAVEKTIEINENEWQLLFCLNDASYQLQLFAV